MTICATPPRRTDGYVVEFDARKELARLVVLVTSAVRFDEADDVAVPPLVASLEEADDVAVTPSTAAGSSSAQLGSVDRIVALFSSDKPSIFEKPS